MTDKTPDLTLKQERFVEEYLIDGNATRAAKQAGYSPKTAAAIGSENLTKPAIIEAIRLRRAQIEAETTVDADTVEREMARIALSSLEDYTLVDSDGNVGIDFRRLTPAQWAAISEIHTETVETGTGKSAKRITRTKFKLHNKVAALDMLGKRFAMFISKVQHTGADDGPIRFEEMPSLEIARRLAFVLDRANREKQAGSSATPGEARTDH